MGELRILKLPIIMKLVLITLVSAVLSSNRLLQQFEAPALDQCIANGFGNCIEYSPDGCNVCRCSGACTKMACFPSQPARCTVCEAGYTLNAAGQCEAIPSCGGIPYCISYKPDNCNICGCGNGLTMAFCTRAFCGPSNPTNECTRCMDGYSLNAQNVCEQTLLVNQVKPAVPQSPQSPSAMCVCPMMYNPVCCAETTYSNSCEARCQGHADTTQCTTGRCSDPIEALPLFQIPH